MNQTNLSKCNGILLAFLLFCLFISGCKKNDDLVSLQKNQTEGQSGVALMAASGATLNTTKTTRSDEYKMTQRSTSVTDFNRDGSRMMQIGQYVYSFGGWHVPEESFNDVYRSKEDLRLWEKRPNAPWHGRHVFGVAKLGEFTYIVGGDNLNPAFDVWRTADGEHWTLLSTNILNNRIYYGCTAHKGYIYVVGGAGYDDVWRSHDGITWRRVANHIAFLNGENFSGSLASFEGKLWMVCGGGSGGGTGLARKTVWSSADGTVWQREPDFGGSGRYYTDVCVWDNKLWVVGGYSDAESNIKSIWYMKPDGTWVEYETPAGYIGRHATGVATYNNKLVITCGNYNNDCWVIEKTK
ncbi:MAG: hypothetical protein M3Y85_10135 [Bacteroidota bacterium]|nr:hypothetical protein [Bacteroidota bacterium]